MVGRHEPIRIHPAPPTPASDYESSGGIVLHQAVIAKRQMDGTSTLSVTRGSGVVRDHT